MKYSASFFENLDSSSVEEEYIGHPLFLSATFSSIILILVQRLTSNYSSFYSFVSATCVQMQLIVIPWDGMVIPFGATIISSHNHFDILSFKNVENNICIVISEVDLPHFHNHKIESSSLMRQQGTYQCEVRQLGTINNFQSNSILITYEFILNGALTLVNNVSGSQLLSGVMEEFNISYWDPLYEIQRPNEVEHLFSIYFDFIDHAV